MNPVSRRPVLLAVVLAALSPLVLEHAVAQDATPAVRDNEAIARAFYEPFNTGDTAIYEEILAPDWLSQPLAPGQAPGRDGFAPVIAAYRAALPDLRFVNEDVLVAGDKVTVRSTFSGTHQGVLFGIPPTGTRIEVMAIDIHRIAGGRIVESWHVEDWLSAFGQLGITYAPPAVNATPTP